MFEVIKMAPWGANEYPITIAELKSAARDMDRVLLEDEKNKLIDYLAFNPECGDIIPDTRGIRKLRWRCGDRGKRKGLRVIYYFHDLNMPLYILAVYGKGETLRLTKREEQEMSKLVRELVREHAARNRARISQSGESA